MGDDRHTQIFDGIMSVLLERARLHGCPLDREACRTTLAMDVELNAQGLEVWQARQAEH